MNRYIRHFLMDAAPEGGDTGGGAPAADPAPAAPVAAPVAAPAAAPGATALSAGTEAPPASNEFIPEKYRVTKEDGTFDMDASARKLAESYTHLEKRMGTGDAPPKDASEYKVTVPEALAEQFKADDEGFQQFAKEAHEHGLTQGQFDYMMGKFFELAPAIAEGNADMNLADCESALSQVWQTPQEMERGKRDAAFAAGKMAEAMGVSFEEINDSLGNNPMFIKMMAQLAPEFREDGNVQGAVLNSAQDVGTLMRSEAYSNEKHPDHAATMAKVRAHYDRKYGSNPVY